MTGLESTLNGSMVPTLIQWGANDRVLHYSGAKILASVMPKAQVAIMEGVGHLPMIEKPEETAEIYMNFLRQDLSDRTKNSGFTGPFQHRPS